MNEEDKLERSFIMIHKDFIENEEFDHRDHFLYLIVKGMAHNRFYDITISSIDSLISVMGFVKNSKNKQGIKESIEKLARNGVLSVYADLACTTAVDELKHSDTYYFKVNKRKYEKSYFSKIYHDDFFKLLTMEEKNKNKLFAVYYNIVSKIYDSISSDGYTLTNVEDISNETGINRKTIPKYLELLMENKLIFYGSIRLSSEKTKNVYSRWEKRGRAIEFIRENS